MRHVLFLTPIFCGVVSLAAAGVCTASTWYVQTLDSSGNLGQYSCLALDGGGHPHITYYDATWGNLKYANGSTGDIRTVDSAGNVGHFTSVALDASGYPHISYYDATNRDLKYAAWNGTTWDIQTVASVGGVGWPNGGSRCIALGLNGYPQIVYQESDWRVWVKYAAWNGTTWDIQTPTPGDGRWTSLAVDASGYPHISYWYFPSDNLEYASWNGTSWDVQTVDSAWVVGPGNSLALDASGYAHISYLDRYGDDWVDTYDLKYAAWNGISWDLQTVDSAGYVGDYTSLALDATGYPRITYYDSTNADLKYAAWNGTSWDIETVDSVGNVGSWTSLALDADGYAHISYYDETNRDLKYATTRPQAEGSHELPATGYYMISFPLTPSSATVHDLLCDDLGDGNYYMWRWQSGGYQTIPTSPPGCQSTTLSMAEGYWILAAASTLGMRGTQPITDQVIPLQAGWNMVAVPAEATMDSLRVAYGGDERSLAQAQNAGWVLATFYYSHDGTGSYSMLTIGEMPPDQLSLWTGYWVLAGIQCSLIVPVEVGPPPPPPVGGGPIMAAARQTAGRAWAFDIQASSGSSADSITIAAADAASEGFDGFALDKPKPPASPGEGTVRLVLRPQAAAPRGLAAASELAMETKGPQASEWDFIVTGGVEGETVTLSWPELSRLPKDRVAILTDCDTGKRAFMRTRAQYEFLAPGEGSTRSLSVTVKPAREGTLLITGLSASPTRGGAWEIGFNLSADAVVTARVYNVTGRLVADITDAEQVARGHSSLSWHRRSLTGTHVPSGAYLLRVTARTEDGQQASAVTTLQLGR